MGQNEIVFLFLGSVSQWHGVDYLINVFNQKNIKDRNDVFLYIVGGKDNSYTGVANLARIKS